MGCWQEDKLEVQTSPGWDSDHERLFLLSGPSFPVGVAKAWGEKVTELLTVPWPGPLHLPEQLCWLRPLSVRIPSPVPPGDMVAPHPLQSQGALAGRLRSFSMQDLRSIPDDPAPTYQDPLYLEDQVPCHRPPIGEWESDLELFVLRGLVLPCKPWLPQRFEEGLAWPSHYGNAQLCLPGLPLLNTGYRAGGLQDSDTDDECWSDTEVVPQPPARPRERPLSRSQSLRVVKRKPLVREVSGKGSMREVGGRCATQVPRA